MRILWLGPQRPHLLGYVESMGDQVEQREEPLELEELRRDNYQWVVSYGYRHIVTEQIIASLEKRIINLHISLLPWNRGADPNLWSFLEDTPKGVTIHYMSAGIDTGEIIAQQEIHVASDDTLRSSYLRLCEAIEALFCEVWPAIRNGSAPSWPQPPGGSAHRMKDKAPYNVLLTEGWDTPVRKLAGKARQP